MQRIIVDITPGFRMPTIHFSQGDVGTQFAVDLRSRFGDSLPASPTVTIQATKPSGFGFTESATSFTNGVAVFTTTADMTDEAGRFPVEIKVVKDSVTLFSANFYMDGEATTHPDGTIDGQQEQVIPELTQLVERVETAASSVLDMTVEAETLAAGSQATYSYDEDTNTATFGIPQGEAGAGAAGVVANAYSSSQTYAVGDYVIHNSNLYRCTTAITTAESFTAGHWTQVVLADDVSDLKSDLEVLGVTDSAIDLSNYDVITGTMQSNGNWGSIDSSSYKSALITDIPSVVRVKAQTNHNAYISFFYKKPSQPTDIDEEVFFCEGETGRHTITQNTEQTIDVPTDCKCIVVTVLNNALDYSPTMSGIFVEIDLAELNSYVYDNVLADETYSKSNASRSFNTVNDTLTHVLIGDNYDGSSVKTQSIGALLIEIPCSGFAQINYPVFKTSQDLGSIFLDENNIVIGGKANKSIATGGNATIDVPKNAVKFVLNISPSLSSFDWNVKLIRANALDLFYEVNALSKDTQSVFEDENRNMCLAGIKTDILTNKIPYHRGFLFHKLQNDDNSLWYGTSFDKISKIGSVSFNPNAMRFAISPKDGRIIATKRDTRDGIYVWDGETETHVTGFTLEPMAWLYNSGVEFINDGTDEYCIFAEYKGSTPYDSFNVWRGKYPYTYVSDWEIVLTQTPTDITHFHMVRRDPWTDILYLTSGDDSAKCKWWYSTDKGATWTLLTTGSTSGYEEHICRCINFVFTADYIYWATDKGTNHCLNRVTRDTNGIIDVSSREKLCDLPASVATNSICYVESPHGIFMYDRIDIGYTADYGKPVPMSFWDIDNAELTTPFIIPLTVNDWGGSRGKCYLNYTNSKQPMPAMGFSIDTPCIFDLVCDNPSNIGTIAYNVGSKTIHTIDY